MKVIDAGMESGKAGGDGSRAKVNRQTSSTAVNSSHEFLQKEV